MIIECSAMIDAVDHDGAAHLEKARTNCNADSIFENFASGIDAVVVKISREDSSFLVIVTCIYNVIERVHDPTRWFGGAEFIEQ